MVCKMRFFVASLLRMTICLQWSLNIMTLRNNLQEKEHSMPWSECSVDRSTDSSMNSGCSAVHGESIEPSRRSPLWPANACLVLDTGGHRRDLGQMINHPRYRFSLARIKHVAKKHSLRIMQLICWVSLYSTQPTRLLDLTLFCQLLNMSANSVQTLFYA